MKKCINLKLKFNGKLYCKLFKKEIPKDYCIGCMDKKFKVYKHQRRTKMLAIPKSVKKIVWERDNHRCIFCGKLVPLECANSHFIKRSQSGLGIEQNILTNCEECHKNFDDTIKRKDMFAYALRYLQLKYNDFDIDNLTYKKR